MRRSFLLTLIFILTAMPLYAADSGTCVDVGNPVSMYYTGENGPVITGDEILLLCTHHTDAALSVTLSGTDAKNAVMQKLAGWYSWQLVSFPFTVADGGTAVPTDDTDLVITEQMTATIGLDLLGSNGTNFIDSTTAKETVFLNSFLSTNVYRMFTMARPITISTSGNLVVSAQFYLLFRRAP